MPEEQIPATAQADTPTETANLPVGSDTPPAQAAPEGAPTEQSEILADLKAARGEQPAATEEDEEAPKAETPAADDEDPNLIRMRADYLKRLGSLQEREKALAEREKALADGGSVTAPAALDTPPASSPDAASPTDNVPPADLASSWAKTREEIVAGWDEVEAPGEERLVAFLDQVVPLLDQFHQTVAAQQQQQLDATAHAIGTAAISAVDLVRDTYGLEVDPVALLGFAENGGLAAVAAAKGVPLQSLVVTPEVLLEAYEVRNTGVLRAGRAKQTAPADTRQPVPDLTRGGAPRVETEPKTELDEILADMRAGRSGG